MSQFIVASRVEGRFGLAIEIIDAADEKAALMARLGVAPVTILGDTPAKA